MDVFLLSLFFSSACCFNLNTNFPTIFKGTTDSYFGYSVALHRNRDGPLALVGAPRSNSTLFRDQLYQPGAVFKCDMETSCVEVVLDKKGNTQTEDGKNNAYHDKKDAMWLGVSLDVQHNSARNDIVACGHLWKNQMYVQHYLANGACYIINGDLDSNNVTKLVPFVKKSKQAIIPPGIYYYAFGQVGTSASFSEDGNYLHLGAPGFYDWTGTVVSYNLSSGQKYGQPYVPDPPSEKSRTPESYIGYSVTSGKFYDGGENYIAVGAPRDGEFYGRVYIYKIQNASNENIIVYQQKNGLQLGEYFGASVLAINLNEDFYTDLIVAAPLHSIENGVDEGKVYIFISNGLGLQVFAELYGRKKTYARFGSAVAHLGDINQDGYNDIAIGAPYEDGKGAIYIYHGAANGLNTQFAQRIAARDIDSSLNGFGIHISKGFDIDSNQYPDVLVGAYSSSNAVLLRTQPVIQASAKLSFTPKQINTNITNCLYIGDKVTCLNMTACLWYAGKHVPPSLEFENEISLEHPIQGNRGFFFLNGSPVLKKKTMLEAGVDHCITEEIFIQTDIKGVIAPLQVLYKYNLIPDVRNAEFKNIPIIDPSSPRNISSSISFVTGCGTDDKCFSDLVVSAKVLGHLQNTPLIIGKNASISILIEISNIGEPAYLAEMSIILPSETPSINQDSCSAKSGSNNLLLCDLGNPLLKGKPEKFHIKLDMTKIPVNQKQIEVVIETRTASFEVNPKDNQFTLSLNLTAMADISITGVSSHEQVPFDDKIENITVPLLLISHTYFVMNHGPSPVSVVDISLFVPTSFQEGGAEVNFVSLKSVEDHSGKPSTITAKCNVTNLIAKPTSTEIKNEFDVMNQTSFFDGISEFQSFRNRRDIREPPKSRNDVLLDCKTTKCISIHCSASPFSDIRSFARIVVTVQLNVTLLNELFAPWHKIEFVTKGVATIRNVESGLFPKQFDETKVKTIVVHSGPPAREKIAHWIIFVSIGIGILLLILILFLLIKFGFFRRMQKEKMEKLKTKDDFDDDDEENR